MPDISMCFGFDCALKKDCYRYRAVPELLQMYFTIPPVKEDKCDYFCKLKKDDRLRSMEEIQEIQTRFEEPNRQALDREP